MGTMVVWTLHLCILIKGENLFTYKNGDVLLDGNIELFNCIDLEAWKRMTVVAQ